MWLQIRYVIERVNTSRFSHWDHFSFIRGSPYLPSYNHQQKDPVLVFLYAKTWQYIIFFLIAIFEICEHWRLQRALVHCGYWGCNIKYLIFKNADWCCKTYFSHFKDLIWDKRDALLQILPKKEMLTYSPMRVSADLRLGDVHSTASQK